MEDCSTDERLQQEMLCLRQWTDEYVERPESLYIVVVYTVGSVLFLRSLADSLSSCGSVWLLNVCEPELL